MRIGQESWQTPLQGTPPTLLRGRPALSVPRNVPDRPKRNQRLSLPSVRLISVIKLIVACITLSVRE